ncbi:FAD-linked oxidase [Polynucleobacter sp. QLW-P1DATA-2]|uniref:FAD-binding oxidoreductase n=1 Tax=Polynucleobacter sp. QLW-P1DATA-2 TaxID=1743167 RepID=UPI0008F8FBF2|nr:FAD-binding oxidoreductase [Polynucleobacter sp. QLW-P1DATA-2]OIN00912.1 FAD-linked oxidase [Polynucleobacter sp. QLW-P1DATA-2]
MKIHGWGRYPITDAKILQPKTRVDCVESIKGLETLIPRGLGRSYGDSANSTTALQSTFLNHFIEFNEQSGVLTCEAGVSIRTILELAVPKGWFIPVTPGTGYVTLGGAIASDVHGKNHHINGTFSEHVISFNIILGTGEMCHVSRMNFPDLFIATCGGMGLTGMIISATIQLKKIQSSQITQTTIKANCLEEVCQQFEDNSASTYSVAWIDCLAKGAQLGRSLLMLGEHAQNNVLEMAKSKRFNIPFEMPSGLLNQHSIKCFNSFYYHKASALNKITLPFEPYFYPLDSIRNWNRLYGAGGFVQYQFVLPKAVGLQGLKKILTKIVDSGKGSFLAVLKVFGKSNQNLLSFPIEGYTLALDFKISKETFALLKELDSMVLDMGGRIYLTKDALLSESTFKKIYPNWVEFEQVRSKYGAHGKFSSDQSKRLGLQ